MAHRTRWAVVVVIGLLAPLLGGWAAPAWAAGAHDPIGAVDSSAPLATETNVVGWALDPDSSASLVVHVYVDNVFAMAATADDPRPDLAAAFPGSGTLHGFDLEVPTPPGQHQLCVYALNVGAGEHALVACRTVRPLGNNPVGALDTVQQTAGAIVVQGWAIDPSTANPTSVDVSVDGATVLTAEAALPRSDVGQAFPLHGPLHGYNISVSTTPGPHTICVSAVNIGPGDSDTHLGCVVSSPLGSSPIGRFDLLTFGIGATSQAPFGGSPDGQYEARALGWGFHPFFPFALPIRVFVDGVERSPELANRRRTDVTTAYPLYGEHRGFDIGIDLTEGAHTVCLSGMDGTVTGASLGCRSFTVDHTPFGSLDWASQAGGVISAQGWAVDPDTDEPVTLHVYVDGQFAGAPVAGSPRPDVAAALPGFSASHGFTISVPVAEGPHLICVYAINGGAGSTNAVLGCRTT